MSTKLRFTGPVRPMTKHDYDALFNDALGDESALENFNQRVHLVKPPKKAWFDVEVGRQTNWMMDSEDLSFMDADGWMCYHAQPLGRFQNVSLGEDVKTLFCETIADHFTGVDVETMRTNPRRYLDLPLVPLVLFLDAGNINIFPSSWIPRLNADFDNLESDGTEADYLNWAISHHPSDGLDVIYQRLRALVHDAEQSCGTFVLA